MRGRGPVLLVFRLWAVSAAARSDALLGRACVQCRQRTVTAFSNDEMRS